MRTRVGNHHRAPGWTGSALTHRVLVTGSRTWVDVETIRAALEQVWGNGSTVPLSGAYPRRVSIASPNNCGQPLGRPDRAAPRELGPLRARSRVHRPNTEMVAARADVCLAFIHAGSAGATHTARPRPPASPPTATRGTT